MVNVVTEKSSVLLVNLNFAQSYNFQVYTAVDLRAETAGN